MPKLKTNRGAAKRFRKTGGGGFKRRQGGLGNPDTQSENEANQRAMATGMS